MKTTKIVISLLIVGLFFVSSAFAQEAPIKIGFIGAMTGGSAVLGQRNYEGFKLYWDELNEKGGLKGRKVDLILDDDEGQAAKGVSAAKKQILKDNIVSAFATVNTVVTMAVVPIFQEYGVPHVTQVFGPTVTKMGSKYVFRVIPSIDADVDSVYEWAIKNTNLKTVAIFSDSGGTGKDFGDAWERGAAKYGLKVLTHEKCNLEDKDFTGQILKIKNLNPQAVVVTMGWEMTIGLVCKEMRRLGLTQPIYMNKLDVTKFVEYGGEATEGVVLSLPIIGFDQPKELADLAKRFKAKYRQDIVLHNVWGYDGASVLGIALERAYPTITRESVYKGITSIHNVRLMQGVFDFTTSQEGIMKANMATIKGGKAVPLQ